MKSRKTMTGTALYLALAALATGAATTQAAQPGGDYMAACEAEVRAQFGTDTDVALVSKRRIPAGTEVKLAARTDRDNSKFVNCWIPNDASTIEGFDQGSNTVAAVIRPVPVIH